MYWKYFGISFSITLSLLVAFTLYLNAIVNRDDPDFQSSYDFVDANSLLEQNINEDFVVIIISSTCPGTGYFMPPVKAATEKLEADGFSFYIIEENYVAQESENHLKRNCQEYDLTSPVFYISPETYPKNGGLFHIKQRYVDFVHDLCGTTDNFHFGYATYIYFKSGVYTEHADYLKEEWLELS